MANVGMKHKASSRQSGKALTAPNNCYTVILFEKVFQTVHLKQGDSGTKILGGLYNDVIVTLLIPKILPRQRPPDLKCASTSNGISIGFEGHNQTWASFLLGRIFCQDFKCGF